LPRRDAATPDRVQKNLLNAAAIPQCRLGVPRTALEIAVFRRHCSETFISAYFCFSLRRSLPLQ